MTNGILDKSLKLSAAESAKYMGPAYRTLSAAEADGFMGRLACGNTMRGADGVMNLYTYDPATGLMTDIDLTRPGCDLNAQRAAAAGLPYGRKVPSAVRSISNPRPLGLLERAVRGLCGYGR